MSQPFCKYLLVRPQDLNHAGTLFGGVMMSMADEMAFVAATLTYPGCTFVTKAFEKFDFMHGAREGHIIEVQAEVLSRGRSSVRVAVRARDAVSGEQIFQTEAVMVNAHDGASVPIDDGGDSALAG